ncbi:MAG: DUF1735 domain-containing protein [Bacteroidota bacterium]|nr:DUF1735 domain-containing protein [Bacteroidota bacterium]
MKSGKLKILLLAAGAMILNSCKQDKVFGDITPNTDRPIIEFSEPSGFKSVAMDYSTSYIDLDITDIRFMIRSYVTKNATAKIIINPGLVYDYNDKNQTNYAVVPASLYGLVNDQFTLSATERSKTVRIHIRPSDVASGQNAIGISIAQVDGGEVSRIAGTLVVAISVKNKYDGSYHLKGFYTRTDNPPYNGPFETDVQMVTTGPNSVAMYWPFGGDYYQPFSNAGNLTAFSNVAPEVFFNGADQVTSINNYTGDPATGPFMTPSPGANSRFVPGATPVIYLKYYYNTNPANRIFADTLTYTGPR